MTRPGTLRPASAATPVPLRRLFVPGGVDCPDCVGTGTRIVATHGFRAPGGWIVLEEREVTCESCGGNGRRACEECGEPADGRVDGTPVCERDGHEIEREQG